MKRIVICMDGTWQTLGQRLPTNISIIARSVAHRDTRPDGTEIAQIVIYTFGIGSSIEALAKRDALEKLIDGFNNFAGGAFGDGLEDAIVDTYLRLVFAYEPGDEIYIFGFSRGAFAARRLAGFVNTAGIVSRRHAEQAWPGFRLYYDTPGPNASEEERLAHRERALQFRRDHGKGERDEEGARHSVDDPPQITYLGVFETVVQRGVRDVLLSFSPVSRQRFRFSHLRVCGNVLSARHAVAVDESRLGFPPMLWEGLDELNAAAWQRLGADPGRSYYEQRWFIGAHGDVGGGEGSMLSAPPLKWIAEGAVAQGLRFYSKHGPDQSPMDDLLVQAGLAFNGRITHPKLSKAWQPMNYPFRPRKIWTAKQRPTITDAQGYLDATVLERAKAEDLRPRYRPSALRPFRDALRE